MSHKRKPNTWFNMASILMIVGMVAGASLTFTKQFTKHAMDLKEAEAKSAGIRAVVPDFDNVPAAESKRYFVDAADKIRLLGEDEAVGENDKFRVLEVFPCKKGKTDLGCAVTTYTEKGYSGKFTLMMAISPEGAIKDVEVLSMTETPGLGTRIADPEFKDQFKGKTQAATKFQVKADGGDVDAISASTISSRAFCDAVCRGFAVYNAFKTGAAK